MTVVTSCRDWLCQAMTASATMALYTVDYTLVFSRCYINIFLQHTVKYCIIPKK